MLVMAYGHHAEDSFAKWLLMQSTKITIHIVSNMIEENKHY